MKYFVGVILFGLPFIYTTIGILTLVSCDKSDANAEMERTLDTTTQERIIPLPTRDGVRDFNLDVGRRDATLPLTHDRLWECSIYVPESVITDSLPLCLALHGGNEEPGAAKRLMDHLIYPALKEQNIILFAPVGGIWWSDITEQRIHLLVDYIKEYWPIDTQKIIVAGYSNGGTVSTYLPLKNPSLFDAAIPMAGNFEGSDCLPIPAYFIHGSQDENYSASDLKAKIERQKVQGCEVQLDLIEGYGHAGGPLVRTSLRNAILWFKNDVW